MSERIEQKNCVFCKYWYGPKADKKIRDGFWFYSVQKGECLKSGSDVTSSCGCEDFTPHRYRYPDLVLTEIPPHSL